MHVLCVCPPHAFLWQVVDPCPASQPHTCDGECSAVDCTVLGQLRGLSGPADAATPPPPAIVLLPPVGPAGPGQPAGPAQLFAQQGGANKTVHLAFGQALPALPCESAAGLAAQGTLGCGTATNATGARGSGGAPGPDLSPFIQVGAFPRVVVGSGHATFCLTRPEPSPPLLPC
jgi:hypothetical protein